MNAENIKTKLSDLIHAGVASGDLNREPRDPDRLVEAIANAIGFAEAEADHHNEAIKAHNQIIDSLPSLKKP